MLKLISFNMYWVCDGGECWGWAPLILYLPFPQTWCCAMKCFPFNEQKDENPKKLNGKVARMIIHPSLIEWAFNRNRIEIFVKWETFLYIHQLGGRGRHQGTGKYLICSYAEIRMKRNFPQNTFYIWFNDGSENMLMNVFWRELNILYYIIYIFT